MNALVSALLGGVVGFVAAGLVTKAVTSGDGQLAVAATAPIGALVGAAAGYALSERSVRG